MDRLTRGREPLALASLVALTLVALARVGLGLSELGPSGSRAVAAARLAPNGGDGALTVLVGGLVATCFLAPAVPARRRFAVWGAVLTVISLLASVAALALTDLATAGWSVVWLVPDLAVPAVVGVALISAALAPGTPAVESPPVPAELAAVPEPAPDPDLQPAWPEDEATGAVWRTAGEAATGAPAFGWGPRDGTSWPLPALPAAPSADEPAEPHRPS